MATKTPKSNSKNQGTKKAGEPEKSSMQTFGIQANMAQLHRLFQRNFKDKDPNLRYPTANDLAKLIGRARLGFFRILDHMKLDHHLPVEFIPERGGYGYTEEVVNFPGIQFCQAELIALLTALNSLKSIRGNPFNEAAESAFHKLVLALDEELTVDLKALEAVVCLRTGGFPAPVDADLIETAVQACIDHEELVLHHRKLPKNGEKVKNKRYRVKPYFLLCAGEVWYLYTWDYESEDIRKFALARTTSIERTGKHFALPSDYDREQILGHGFGFGLFGDDNPLPARVRFNTQLAPLIRERIWHPSQKITNQSGSDGEIVLNLNVSHDFELINWIRGWGRGATVLEPEELRGKVDE